MSKYKKYLILFLISTCFIFYFSSNMTLFAAETNLSTNIITSGTQRTTDLEYRYMYINGLLYYRRWDVTNNCWYDAEWILVE